MSLHSMVVHNLTQGSPIPNNTKVESKEFYVHPCVSIKVRSTELLFPRIISSLPQVCRIVFLGFVRIKGNIASADGTCRIWLSSLLSRRSFPRSSLTYASQSGRIVDCCVVNNTHSIVSASDAGISFVIYSIRN